MNSVVFSGRLIWAGFKENEDYDSLSMIISVNSRERKQEGEQYQPSFSISTTLTGKYAKAMKFIADEYKEHPMTIVVAGSLCVPQIQSRDGEMEVGPLRILYPQIDAIKLAPRDDDSSQTETRKASSSKKKATNVEEQADEKLAEDLF